MALFQINNFSGILTRKKVGTMNSGFTPVGRSHSIDPFGEPPGLNFNEAAVNLDTGHSIITDIVVDGTLVEESGTLFLYCIDRSGRVYKINTSTDSIALLVDLGVSNGITLKYGGGIRFIQLATNNQESQLLIAHDTGIIRMDTNASNVATIRNFTNISVATTDVNTGNSTIAFPATLFFTPYVGQAIFFQGSVGTPPSPLIVGVTYYIIPFDSSHFQLAASLSDALNNIPITITTQGITGPFAFQIDMWKPNVPHPISQEFFGGIFIGNGPYLVDYAAASQTISHTSRLNPTFPLDYTITSLEVDGEGRYLRINGTTGTFSDIIAQNPLAQTQTPISRTVYWNGIDDTYDSYDPFQQSTMSSMFSFLGFDISFGNDFWGSSLFQVNQGAVDKMLAMKEVKPPNAGSITSTGSLLFFAAPYYVQAKWLAGIFGYGKLDDTDDNSLFPLLGLALSDSNTICRAVGMLTLVQNRYLAESGSNLTNSKFYVSTYEVGSTPHANLYSFSLTPSGGTANGGVYQTQTENLTLSQQVDRVLFELLPTVSGVSFKLELVDVDGTVPTGGSFTYTYAAGSDPTQLQGSLETFDWAPPQVKNFQALGIRLTNLGTVQPGIRQIYIETHDVDKSAVPE